MWCNRQTPSPPGLWPVRGGSPFPVPSAHARLVDTAATTVAYHCFFFFPRNGLQALAFVKRTLASMVYGLLRSLTFNRKVTKCRKRGCLYGPFSKWGALTKSASTKNKNKRC